MLRNTESIVLFLVRIFPRTGSLSLAAPHVTLGPYGGFEFDIFQSPNGSRVLNVAGAPCPPPCGFGCDRASGTVWSRPPAGVISQATGEDLPPTPRLRGWEGAVEWGI